ncbi:HAD family hydrolase [Erysipelothrix piscisicarius]|uniref:HAD family hydrolase n=1 Tax=Erysipelothrix piscisicarius TaxID=2485784 RepID=A0A3S5HK10_9FIRM|nr:HAD family hydrolase [Erysipelothrix piscisicarius]AZK43623.1 HAD family hydrolase [Erysipelothrix piscisicarius]
MNYDAVIYDLDGTVVNTFDMNLYPLMKIVEEEPGIHMTYDELIHLTCYDGHGVLKALGISTDVYPRWVQYVNEYPHPATLFDGIEFVLESLDGIVKQGVASSKRRLQYDIDVVENGMDGYFNDVVLSGDTQHHKPHPEPLLVCAEMLDITPNRALYVGDSIFDYQAAKAAGMAFGLASWGNVSMEGMDEIDFVLETPADILKAVF